VDDCSHAGRPDGYDHSLQQRSRGALQLHGEHLLQDFSDFLPFAQLNVFRIHKGAGWGTQGTPGNGYAAINGTMCTPSSPTYSYNYTGQDMGSDVGGAIWTITADQDFALDYQGGLTPSSSLCGQSGGANVGLVGQVQ
jgi:hypothetical protein